MEFTQGTRGVSDADASKRKGCQRRLNGSPTTASDVMKQIIVIVVGIFTATVAAAEEFNEICDVPQRNVETVGVKALGKITTDPIQYTAGWFSLRAISNTEIVAWGGSTSATRNGIRIYNRKADAWEGVADPWTIVHPNSPAGSFLDSTDSWTLEAREQWCPNDPAGCKILAGTDNHLQFYIPDRNEMLIWGTAYGGTFGGVYDFDAEKWTVIWKDSEDIGTHGYITAATVEEAHIFPLNASHRWVDPDGPGGSPGVGVIIGGSPQGGPTDKMLLIKPYAGDAYVFEMVEDWETPPTAFRMNRNGAVAAGECFYLFGGQTESGPTNAVWRYHVPTDTWARMADMPTASAWNAATFDPRTNRVVVLTGTDHVYLYDLEENTWSEVTAKANLPDASQAASAYAWGTHIFDARSWNGDSRARGDYYGIQLYAKRYEQPEVTVRHLPEDWAAPQYQTKHMEWAWNPVDGRFYGTGGDHRSLHGASSHSDIHAYDPKTDTWELVLPYCVPDGKMAPMEPDQIGWLWDSNRNGFWFVPGSQWGDQTECATGTYVDGKIMFFDPVTQTYSVPPQEDRPELGSVIQQHAVYDPVRDRIYQIASHAAGAWNPETGEWTRYRHFAAMPPDMGGFGGTNFDRSVPAIFHGRLYVMDYDDDPGQSRLFYWEIGTQNIVLVGHVSDKHDSNILKTFGSVIIAYHKWEYQGDEPTFSIFDPITETWATVPTENTVMVPEVGTSWGLSDKGIAFIFGNHEKTSPEANEFYLVDLSFLPRPLAHGGVFHRIEPPMTNSPLPNKDEPDESTNFTKEATASAHQVSRTINKTPRAQAGDTASRMPSNNLPPAGHVILGSDISKPYNLPHSSWLHDDRAADPP